MPCAEQRRRGLDGEIGDVHRTFTDRWSEQPKISRLCGRCRAVRGAVQDLRDVAGIVRFRLMHRRWRRIERVGVSVLAQFPVLFLVGVLSGGGVKGVVKRRW